MVKQIDPKTLAARLKAGEPTHLLDVREEWEHARVALPGSQLIPLSQLQLRAAEVEPPPGALVVAYCHHGMRSLSAAALLEQLGTKDVASLSGGIDAWSVQIDPRLVRY